MMARAAIIFSTFLARAASRTSARICLGFLGEVGEEEVGVSLKDGSRPSMRPLGTEPLLLHCSKSIDWLVDKDAEKGAVLILRD